MPNNTLTSLANTTRCIAGAGWESQEQVVNRLGWSWRGLCRCWSGFCWSWGRLCWSRRRLCRCWRSFSRSRGRLCWRSCWRWIVRRMGRGLQGSCQCNRIVWGRTCVDCELRVVVNAVPIAILNNHRNIQRHILAGQMDRQGSFFQIL